MLLFVQDTQDQVRPRPGGGGETAATRRGGGRIGTAVRFVTIELNTLSSFCRTCKLRSTAQSVCCVACLFFRQSMPVSFCGKGLG